MKTEELISGSDDECTEKMYLKKKQDKLEDNDLYFEHRLQPTDSLAKLALMVSA